MNKRLSKLHRSHIFYLNLRTGGPRRSILTKVSVYFDPVRLHLSLRNTKNRTYNRQHGAPSPSRQERRKVQLFRLRAYVPSPPKSPTEPTAPNKPAVSVLLYGHGDVFAPLPETVRVLDEILSDFVQGVAFEANRAAHHAGRQKIKAEDFQFAFRKNPAFLGKIQEVLEKKADIESARKIFKDTEAEFSKEMLDKVAGEDEAARAGGEGKGGGSKSGSKSGSKTGRGRGRPRKGAVEEEVLGEADDDAEAEADVMTR